MSNKKNERKEKIHCGLFAILLPYILTPPHPVTFFSRQLDLLSQSVFFPSSLIPLSFTASFLVFLLFYSSRTLRLSLSPSQWISLSPVDRILDPYGCKVACQESLSCHCIGHSILYIAWSHSLFHSLTHSLPLSHSSLFSVFSFFRSSLLELFDILWLVWIHLHI